MAIFAPNEKRAPTCYWLPTVRCRQRQARRERGDRQNAQKELGGIDSKALSTDFGSVELAEISGPDQRYFRHSVAGRIHDRRSIQNEQSEKASQRPSLR